MRARACVCVCVRVCARACVCVCVFFSEHVLSEQGIPNIRFEGNIQIYFKQDVNTGTGFNWPRTKNSSSIF